MGGALLTTAIGYRFVLGRSGPKLGEVFWIPTRQEIDRSLVGGSALFGVGWGIAGFCPSGAIPALGTARTDVVLFVAAMISGILLANFWRRGPGLARAN